MNKIEDKQTLGENMDILEYSNDLTNKDFVSTDIDNSALANLLKPTAEEVDKEK